MRETTDSFREDLLRKGWIEGFTNKSGIEVFIKQDFYCQDFWHYLLFRDGMFIKRSTFLLSNEILPYLFTLFEIEDFMRKNYDENKWRLLE